MCLGSGSIRTPLHYSSRVCVGGVYLGASPQCKFDGTFHTLLHTHTTLNWTIKQLLASKPSRVERSDGLADVTGRTRLQCLVVGWLCCINIKCVRHRCVYFHFSCSDHVHVRSPSVLHAENTFKSNRNALCIMCALAVVLAQ